MSSCRAVRTWLVAVACLVAACTLGLLAAGSAAADSADCPTVDSQLQAATVGTSTFDSLVTTALDDGCVAYVESASTLYIEFLTAPHSGQSIIIGSTGVDLFDIALSSPGVLYGVDSSSNLYRVNVDTGAATKIGPTGYLVNGLVVSPRGVIYGSGNQNLLTIDATTGKGTLVGNTGYTSGGDLVFSSSGTLYMTTGNDDLVSLDASTGAGTLVGPLHAAQVYGLGFTNGVLYGADSGGALLTIDPSTGTATVAATGGPIANGMATLGPASQSQTINFSPPASGQVGGSDVLTATAVPSGLPVKLSEDPSTTNDACALNGNTVSYVHVGSCVIDANQSGNAVYDPAPQVQKAIAVGKAPQTITLSAPPSGQVNGSGPLTAAASSGLPVALSVDPATANDACAINGHTVSYVHAGSCVIDANQPGNGDYDPAPQVQRTVTVGKLSQIITMTAPSSGQVNRSDPLSAGASSGLPVALSVDPTTTNNACALNGNTVSYEHAGSCVIDADQPGNGDYDPAPRVQRTITVRVPAFKAPAPVALPPAFGVAGIISLPSNAACLSKRHFVIHIRPYHGLTYKEAFVSVAGRRAATLVGRRLQSGVNLRGLPRGTYTVTITVLTTDGRAITGTRTYHTCRGKRLHPKRPPKL